MAKLTKCKACGKEISKGAKSCPECGKDNRSFVAKHKILTAIAVLVILGAIGSAAGGKDEGQDVAVDNGQAVVEQNVEQQVIEYTQVNIDTLISDLKSNPLKANQSYKDKYLEVTGYVNNIDAQGKYFSIRGTDEWDFTNIQIYINKDQLDQVANFEKGQSVTLKIMIKDVGEVLGYSAELKEIVQ